MATPHLQPLHWLPHAKQSNSCPTKVRHAARQESNACNMHTHHRPSCPRVRRSGRSLRQSCRQPRGGRRLQRGPPSHATGRWSGWHDRSANKRAHLHTVCSVQILGRVLVDFSSWFLNVPAFSACPAARWRPSLLASLLDFFWLASAHQHDLPWPYLGCPVSAQPYSRCEQHPTQHESTISQLANAPRTLLAPGHRSRPCRTRRPRQVTRPSGTRAQQGTRHTSWRQHWPLHGWVLETKPCLRRGHCCSRSVGLMPEDQRCDW